MCLSLDGLLGSHRTGHVQTRSQLWAYFDSSGEPLSEDLHQ